MGDIFDPIHCTIAYNRCATNEQIQTFLWQQIQRLQSFCNDFNNHQNEYNVTNSKNVSENTQAIALIKNDINSLKSLQNTLSSQFTQLQADNNSFKLAVDATLDLYQKTINNIVSNIDKLTVDGQALQNRVAILESQTDLNKLQQIIKSYEDIKNDFSKQLEDESVLLKQYVDEAIAGLENSFNIFKVEINSIVSSLSSTVLGSNESVVKLTQLYSELSELITSNQSDNQAAIIQLRKELEDYSDNGIEQAMTVLRKELDNVRVKLQDEFNQLSVDSETKFIEINKKLDEFRKELDEGLKDLNEKYVKIIEISRDLEKDNHHINHRLENALKLVYQANDNAKMAVLGLAEARNVYDANFIRYDYKIKRMQESIQYINSSIVRGFIEEEGLYNIKIALLEAIDGTFKLSSKFYSFIIPNATGSNDVLKEYVISLDAVNYNEYKVIADDSYDEYRLIVRSYLIGGDVKYGVDVKHIDNEFNQIEFPLVKIIREEDKDYNDIVDTDIHKIPEPVEPTEPECDAMKVIIVNDKCEPVHNHDHCHDHGHHKPLPCPPPTPPDVLDRLPNETYAEWMCRLSEWALKLKEINDVTPIPDSCSIVDGETGVVFPPPQNGKDGKDGVGIEDIEISVHEKEGVDILKEPDIGSDTK